MTLEDYWQAWLARFDQPHNLVLRLFHDRAMWRTIQAMLDTNSAPAAASASPASQPATQTASS